MSNPSVTVNRAWAVGANRLVYWFSRYWLFLFTLFIGTFAAPFYAGDAFGSFNSWMRLVAGVLFGLAVAWFCYPRLHCAFRDTARQIEAKFQAAKLRV